VRAIKAIYRPVIAHAYHAHALRIYLLKGRIPSTIKSAYTNEWYEDMPALPDLVVKVTSLTEAGIWKVRIARNPVTSWNPRQPEDKSEGDRTERDQWITNM
jgi:hypothetical protein